MIKVCPICGKEFIAKRKEQIFCSVECRYIGSRQKVKVFCENCNKEFYKFPKEIKKTKHNFCCKECFDKYQKKENKIIVLKNYAKIIIDSVKYGTFEVKIDIEDIEKVKNFKWNIRKTKEGIPYVASHKFISTKNRKSIQLHRFIINNPNNKVIDHINHDTLDNRKINLRICTIAENNQNRVTCLSNNIWKGQISIKNKYYEKKFKSKKEAQKWCAKIYKKFNI